MFEMTIAIAGATLTLPPAAPVLARVVSEWVVVARTLRLPPPFSVPVIRAVVSSSATTTTTEAPMPTLDAPLTPPVAAAGSATVVAGARGAGRAGDVPGPGPRAPL